MGEIGEERCGGVRAGRYRAVIFWGEAGGEGGCDYHLSFSIQVFLSTIKLSGLLGLKLSGGVVLLMKCYLMNLVNWSINSLPSRLQRGVAQREVRGLGNDVTRSSYLR